jgi:hypothetical protein
MQQALEALNRSDYLGWQLNIPIIKALSERLAKEDDPIVGTKTWFNEEGKIVQQELKRSEVYKPAMQPCAGRNCGSTNPNLHSAECFEDYEKSTGMSEWKGLTDEDEIPWDGVDAKSFAKAIEAKLKEKNT